MICDEEPDERPINGRKTNKSRRNINRERLKMGFKVTI